MILIQGRVYTANPASVNPNTTPPVAARVTRLSMAGFLWGFNDTTTNGVECTWTIWLRDDRTDTWWQVATSAGNLSRRNLLTFEPHELVPQNADSVSGYIDLVRAAGDSMVEGETLTLNFYSLGGI